jgi:hypothetical protein
MKRFVLMFFGLIGLSFPLAGCGDGGSGEAGPIGKETAPAKTGGEQQPTSGGRTTGPSTP